MPRRINDPAKQQPTSRLSAWLPARRLAKLCRAWTWYEVIAGVEPRAWPQLKEAVPYWLLLFLNGTG